MQDKFHVNHATTTAENNNGAGIAVLLSLTLTRCRIMYNGSIHKPLAMTC